MATPRKFPFGYGPRQSAPFAAPTRPPVFGPQRGLARGPVTGDRRVQRTHYGRWAPQQGRGRS